MLYKEIVAVCSGMHSKHKHPVWAERSMLELMVDKVTNMP